MTYADYLAGKLEQACGNCGRWEAAGFYCTGCAAPMTEADWYPNGDEDRRAVAHARAAVIRAAAPKRPRGRPKANVPAELGL
jgi:hypothetical protein